MIGESSEFLQHGNAFIQSFQGLGEGMMNHKSYLCHCCHCDEVNNPNKTSFTTSSPWLVLLSWHFLKLTNIEISCSTSFRGYISLVHAHPKRNGCYNDGRLSSPQLQRVWSNDATWNSFVSGNATSTVVALRNFKLMIPGIENYMIFTCLNFDVSFSCWHPTVHHGGTLLVTYEAAAQQLSDELLLERGRPRHLPAKLLELYELKTKRGFRKRGTRNI